MASKIQQAAQAALTAAAAEAWRSRKEPGGPFTGAKARRILTAAVGAGGIDALVDRDPNKHGTRHVGEGAIGGLLLNRLVNGSRSEDLNGGRRGSGRSQSRGRNGGGGVGGAGGLAGLAGAGALAAAGKKFLDSRSKSRGRNKRYSSDENSSRSPPPRARRSRSVSTLINNGMAKMGLADSARATAGTASAGRKRGGVDDDDDDVRRGGRSDGGGAGARRGVARDRDRGRGVAVAGGEGGRAWGRRNESTGSNSSSDFSLSEEEKSRRKMRGKEFLTAGLATVATVHAAHEIYESVEKRKKRRQMVKDGSMTSAEERRHKSKALVQDAFAVGIAGLGIKGAVGTWKEMKEQRDECHEIESKLDKHRRIMAEREAKALPTGSASGSASIGSRTQANANRSRIAAGPYNVNQGGGSGGSSGGAAAAYATGPVYHDGNPYAAAVPAAPGYDTRRA